MYWADEDVVFMVTSATPWRVFDEEAPYTEMDWLMPEEIRFLASIFLCQKRDDAKLCFYPLHHFAPKIARKSLKLESEKIATQLKETIAHNLRYPDQPYYASALEECAKLRYTLLDPDSFKLASQQEYWTNISTKDYVLLRGLSALLKSDMLSCYYEFYEEGTIQTFIALDASFQLILRRLRKEGIRNPNAKTAAKWLYEHFDKHLGFERQIMERYFEEFYDQRVMTLHPASRFGDSPYAPLAIDDFYHLRSSLPEIFAYLITGSHSVDFLEEVERRKSRKW